MRVALVIQTYSESRGGAERACASLARGLADRGHEVHVFAARFGAATDRIIRHEVPTRELFSSWRHTSFAARSKELLERERFDIIHSFTRTYHQDILRLGGGAHAEYLERMEADRSWLWRWFARINPKERAQLKLERLGFARGAYRKIVAVSARVKDEVVRHYGVPPDDIVVIHNGVDTQRFTPDHRQTHRARLRGTFGVRESDIVYLFCGSGFRRKGLMHAIEAMALLPREIPARLFVVGEGDPAPFRRAARRMRLTDRVFFMGGRDNVHEFYAAADVLVHPTLYDPFPNVCLEAMACGVPVVTTRVTGVAEIISDGIDSFVIEDGADVAALAQRCRMLADPELRAKIGAAAVERARACSLTRTIEANLALYDEILRARASAPVV